MMQHKITAKNKSKINIGNEYIQDAVVEAPRGAAEPPKAQSIRRRRFRYLKRVKPHALQPMMQHKITAKNKSKINIGNKYIRDPIVEAPRGAAEPPQAQSIRCRRFRYLKRVKSHAPQPMMQHKITAKNKFKINIGNKLLIITFEMQLLKTQEVRQSPHKREACGGADFVP
jgi:hypothetical protein